jgi:hypothetical protein
VAAVTPLPNESISLNGGGELNDAKVGLKRQTSGTLGERTAGLGKVRESRRYRDRATGY